LTHTVVYCCHIMRSAYGKITYAYCMYIVGKKYRTYCAYGCTVDPRMVVKVFWLALH